LDLDLHRLFQDCLNYRRYILEKGKYFPKKYKPFTYDDILKKYNSIFAEMVVALFTNKYPTNLKCPDYTNQIDFDVLNELYNSKSDDELTEEQEKMYILDMKNIYSSCGCTFITNDSEWGVYADALSILQDKFTEIFSEPDNELLIKIFSDLQINLSVSFKLDVNNKIYYEYEALDILTILSLDLTNVISNNIQIKECQNCHKFFIPSNRSDEIYCDRIFKNGKTCKEIGYDEKLKNNADCAFQNLYTKARKKRHAKITYYTKLKDKDKKEAYFKEQFEPWKIDATARMEEFKSNNDLQGFQKWLDDNKDKKY
jgi:hypothetical protein